jgi:acetylornithine deacetylase/succinyl-diaminopimelate desuccinylase-like protein
MSRALRARALCAIAVAALAGCRRAPGIRAPDWQPEMARTPERWLQNPDIRLLRDYVRVPTVDPPGNERPGAELLKSYLDCEGVPSELICPEKDRCNLYARIKGKDSRRMLLLLNHIDVVPVYRAGWTVDPFGGAIKQSYLYGRGSYDMKSTGIAQIVAFAELARSGIIPERDVVFLAECGEEFEWTDGVRWIFEHRPDVVAGVDCVLNEGGITEIVTGSPRYFGIEIAQGGQAYALLSSDREEDLKPLEKFKALEMYEPPEPAVQRFLNEVAEFRAPYFANAFRHPWLVKDPEVRKWIPFQNLSLITGGAMFTGAFPADRLPGYPAAGKFDSAIMVSLPVGVPAGPTLDRVIAENLRPGVRVIHREVSPVTACSPFDTADIRALRRVLGATNPGVPGIPIVNAFAETTSAVFRARGIPAYGFTPFQMDPVDSARRHGDDERIFLPFFTRGMILMREVLFELSTIRQEQEWSARNTGVAK